MIHYKDRAFCDSDCINSNCYRHMGEREMIHAESIGLPVSWCDFSKDCDDYIIIKDTDIDPGDLEGIIEDN